VACGTGHPDGKINRLKSTDNGVALSGFDIPPSEGWQQWMDTLSGTALPEGTNTIKIERDRTATDPLLTAPTLRD